MTTSKYVITKLISKLKKEKEERQERIKKLELRYKSREPVIIEDVPNIRIHKKLPPKPWVPVEKPMHSRLASQEKSIEKSVADHRSSSSTEKT